VFRAGKGRKVGRASRARSRSGREEGATLTPCHSQGDFSGIQKAGEAGHVPYLEILALFENAAWHVGADIEKERLDRANFVLDLLNNSATTSGSLRASQTNP
jgi:hypothetical protein